MNRNVTSYLNRPNNKNATCNLVPEITSVQLITFSLSSKDHNIVLNNPISIACVEIVKQ